MITKSIETIVNFNVDVNFNVNILSCYSPENHPKRLISWDKLVQKASDVGDRYRVYKHKRSTFIHIIDRFNNNKKVSLKWLYVDVLEDRLLALKIFEHLGEETFPLINVVTLIERIRNNEVIDIAEHNNFD